MAREHLERHYGELAKGVVYAGIGMLTIGGVLGVINLLSNGEPNYADPMEGKDSLSLSNNILGFQYKPRLIFLTHREGLLLMPEDAEIRGVVDRVAGRCGLAFRVPSHSSEIGGGIPMMPLDTNVDNCINLMRSLRSS